ncbi:MAG: AAA family ATPase [Candidatus Methanoperedens sp.]|nr:AAA family ATPase [Candidatus Methanoperedens sp.]
MTGGNAGIRYWKISPGKGAENWEVCRDNNIISIGWNETEDWRKTKFGDLTTNTDNEKIKMVLKNYYPKFNSMEIGQSSAIIRLFLEIKPGDKVVVYDKNYHINAMCKVIGEYEFEEDYDYPHTKKVEWIKIFSPPFDIRPIKLDTKMGVPKTVIKMTERDWNAIYNYAIRNGETEEKEKKEEEVDMDNPHENLNVILYGPPGTGKTYETPNKALEIIHKDNNYCSGKERRELVQEFNKLLEKKQIKFITFHQSYSYEDFIEGIRPESKPNGSIEYPVKDGLFKQMCFEAAYELIKDQIENKDISFELAFKQFTDKFNDQKLNDQKFLLKTKNDKPVEIISIEDNVRIKIENGNEYPVSIAPLREVFQKWDQIEKVDDVWEKLKVGGGVESYVYAIVAYLKDLSSKIQNNNDSDIGYEAKKAHVLGKLSLDNFRTKSGEPHVLIIDEINRGNISKIFGELITLVEDDKRLGAENELTATLPYSKERFGVPSNLYIIGTMNTADRSIALLDIALRRRFTFEEMMPKPELLDGISINGINLAELLENLNNRITALIDRDHQIGHSYFLNLKGLEPEDAKNNLVSIWYKKIIPLLQEYFYNDWERLSLVLNEGFILKEDNPFQGDYSCSYVYRIKPYDQEEFKHNLESIMSEAQNDNDEKSME